ncbi:hypothetical protein M408DRAFT_111050 [Serendipita vermifera MAFF 305830]|uniref:Uncharacterized protein n=1 Tax=Serendipita vermifera MAFF 305830 TaxID=933852 RepID=A0A0C2WQP1_SERVB|nr:hypothetical protein M408DRAFT_168510 [Serendipita vermifera MAFF 305830]KIM21129.1 hypothetical protein M408DRAFT_111050 [Serendipita vermifera MAFF 305830]
MTRLTSGYTRFKVGGKWFFQPCVAAAKASSRSFLVGLGQQGLTCIYGNERRVRLYKFQTRRRDGIRYSDRVRRRLGSQRCQGKCGILAQRGARGHLARRFVDWISWVCVEEQYCCSREGRSE